MGLYYPVVVKGKYFDSVRQASKELHICAKYIRRRCKHKDKPEEFYYTDYRIPEEKKCTHCNKVKPLSEFFNCKNTRDLKSTDCKKCSVKSSNKHRKDNFEQYRNTYVKRVFNITLEEYNKMFEDQDGCCAICGIHQKDLKRTLFVDHNHETGKIRGLLCGTCNMAIGFLKDDTGVLQNAIDYLNKNN
jgi:hypothetical protein